MFQSTIFPSQCCSPVHLAFLLKNKPLSQNKRIFLLRYKNSSKFYAALRSSEAINRFGRNMKSYFLYQNLNWIKLSDSKKIQPFPHTFPRFSRPCLVFGAIENNTFWKKTTARVGYKWTDFCCNFDKAGSSSFNWRHQPSLQLKSVPIVEYQTLFLQSLTNFIKNGYVCWFKVRQILASFPNFSELSSSDFVSFYQIHYMAIFCPD